MYVCLCNGINDREVRQAADAGAGTPAKVFKSLGCKPQCGKCVGTMRQVIDGAADAGCGGSGRCPCAA